MLPPVSHAGTGVHRGTRRRRPTELADQLGVTKQAVGHWVDDLVDFGLVERVPDPDDGRAKLVRWSEAGREGLSRGLGILEEIEAELADRLGRAEVDEARELLVETIEYLERMEPGSPDD